MVVRGGRLVAAWVLGSVIGAAAPAMAFPPVPKIKVDVPKVVDPSEAWSKAMWKVNALSQEGINALPGLIDSGDDPKKVKGKLDKAGAKYKEAKGHYTTVPDPKSVNEGATNYYLTLEASVKNGALALACLEAHKPIEKSFGEGKPVNDDLITRYEQAAAAYQAGAIGEDGAREAAGWVDQAAKFKAMNPKVAEMKASGELEIKRAAEAKAEGDAMSALDKYLDGFEKAADADMGPIPEADLVTGFDAQLQIVLGFRPDVGPYYAWRTWRYHMYNAWHSGGVDAVAKHLGATVESKGQLAGSGKDLKVQAKGVAGRCYAAVTHWAERGGEPKAELDVIATKNVSFAHQFNVWANERGRSVIGVCTNKDAPIELRARLEYAGTTQRLDYGIVSWPKAELPEMFMGHIRTYPDDQADPDRWYDLFTDPIPMTFFYTASGKPVIGSEVGAVRSERVFFLDGDEQHSAGKLQAKAPETLTFEAKWQTPYDHKAWRTRCDEGPMAGPDCQKLVKCLVNVDKQWEPKWSRASEALDKANILNEDRLRVARDKVDEGWVAAHQSQCIKPIASKMDARMQAVYTRLVDWFNQTRPSAAIDVPGKLRAMEITVERGGR